eukprot:Selendium_serpulae@DN5497_c0_g1_i7.p1
MVSMTLLWVVTFLFLAFGARVMGYLMYATMALPTVLLLVLMITGCTLPGAELGIDAYIGKFDFSVFVTKPDIWSAAAAQVFFSTSLGSAVMMTFASYNRQDNPCAQDSYIVCAADLCFSFISAAKTCSQLTVSEVMVRLCPSFIRLAAWWMGSWLVRCIGSHQIDGSIGVGRSAGWM